MGLGSLITLLAPLALATPSDPSPGAEEQSPAPAVSSPARGEKDHVDPDDRRTRWLESAPFDLVGGGSRRGDWAVELSAGYPWQRLRAQLGVGRGLTPLVAPYLVLATRHTLLMDRTTVTTAGDDEVSWSARHAWILWGQLGLAVAITEHVGLDLGVDLPWVDPPAPSIPGFHAGVILGGWRPR